MKQDWTDKLPKKMFDYEEQAPEGLWDNIEKSIHSTDDIDRNRHAKSVWIRYSSIAVAAAILCLFGIFIANKYSVMDSSLKHVSKIEHPSGNHSINEPLSDQKDLMADAPTTKQQSYERIFVRHASSPMQYDEPSRESTVNNTISDTIKENQVVTNEKRQSETTVIAKTEERRKTGNHYNDVYAQLYKNTQRHSESGLKFNLYASNIPVAADNNSAYSSTLMAAKSNNNLQCDADNMSFTSMVYQPNINNPLTDVLTNNFTKDTKTDIKHKQPIRFGITVSYEINRRWALESGITYTYLTSDIYSGNANNNYQSNQKLHYLGIPLNIIYNMWERKGVSVYLSGGGMGEICIDGKLNTDYVIDNTVESSGSEKIHNHHPQWSVNGAAGLQYSFIPNCGIYVEPGVSYYFDDGSDIQTIYKEHPTNFSLKLGLRFRIK